MFPVNWLFFQGEQTRTNIKRKAELFTVPRILILLGLTVVLILSKLIVPSNLETLWFLTLSFTAFVMPWWLSAGKEPRIDLVSLLLPPLVLGSVLLPTVPLDVASETMLVLVLTLLGTLLTRPFGAKFLEIFVPLLINIVVFFSRFGIVTEYKDAITIVITLTVVLASYLNVSDSLKGIDRAVEKVFVIVLRIAKLVARLDPTNRLTEETAEGLVLCIVKIIESPSTRFAYVPAMSVLVTLVPRAPAHVTFVSAVVTALSSLLVILFQRKISERPVRFTVIIFYIVSVALVLVNSFSLLSVLLTTFGLSVLFAANFEIPDVLKQIQQTTQLCLSLWEMYCTMIRPNRCTDSFNLFFPEFVALITMTTEGCSQFAICAITSLTLICKRVCTSMLWNHFSSTWITLLIYFIQFLILLLVVSSIRAIYGGLFAFWARHIIVNPSGFQIGSFVPLLITLFAMGTTSFFIMVPVITGLIFLMHIILRKICVFLMSLFPYNQYLFQRSIVNRGISHASKSIFVGLQLSFESKVWALILAAGLVISVLLVPVEEIGMVELLTLVFVILIIAETNTAPWPKQCLSE